MKYTTIVLVLAIFFASCTRDNTMLPQSATSKSRTTSVDTTILNFDDVVTNLVESGYTEIARPNSFFDPGTVYNYQKVVFYQDPDDLAKVYCAYGWDVPHRKDAEVAKAVCTKAWQSQTSKGGKVIWTCGNPGNECEWVRRQEGSGEIVVDIIFCDTPPA